MTLVFMMLIVRLKLSQAEEKPSSSCCTFCSVLAFTAQSSANRKSLITVSFTFVTACMRLRLNRHPSDLYLILRCIPPSASCKASVSMAENNVLKRVGASTHPCVTLLVTKKASDVSPSSRQLSDVVLQLIHALPVPSDVDVVQHAGISPVRHYSGLHGSQTSSALTFS